MTHPKSHSPPQVKNYSINELSQATGMDRRTIGKRMHGVPAAEMRSGKPRWTLDQLESAVKEKASPTLRDAKLQEEIRKLRLRNDRDEGKVVARVEIANKLRTALGRMRQVLEQRLVNELATAVAGLEPAQVRIKTKQIYDEAMGEIRSLDVEMSVRTVIE